MPMVGFQVIPPPHHAQFHDQPESGIELNKKALSQLAVGNEEEWSLDEKQTVGGRDAAIEYLHGVFTARLRFVQTPVTREQYLSTHNGYIAKKKPPKFGGKRGVNISA